MGADSNVQKSYSNMVVLGWKYQRKLERAVFANVEQNFRLKNDGHGSELFREKTVPITVTASGPLM